MSKADEQGQEQRENNEDVEAEDPDAEDEDRGDEVLEDALDNAQGQG